MLLLPLLQLVGPADITQALEPKAVHLSPSPVPKDCMIMGKHLKSLNIFLICKIEESNVSSYRVMWELEEICIDPQHIV